MTEFKYCVYCEEEPAVCFESEAEAMKFAREDTSMYKNVRVEKSEVDDGEVVNNEVIWTASNSIPEEDENLVSDNPFDTDFPKSDIEDIDISDDPDFGPEAWIDDNKFPNLKEAVDALEENESEVECKCCFDLFPKETCIKTDKGYICPKCNQEMKSHQGTNLDLIDADPFDLDYDDPRDPEEDEELEVKEGPVDANEIRKHEAGIEENLEEHINDRPADIESDQKLQGTDNAVVDCEVAKVIAHSEDEKPLDCKMEKPALEEPLAGEKVDIKLNEANQLKEYEITYTNLSLDDYNKLDRFDKGDNENYLRVHAQTEAEAKKEALKQLPNGTTIIEVCDLGADSETSDVETALSTPGTWAVALSGEDTFIYDSEEEARRRFDDISVDELPDGCEAAELLMVDDNGNLVTVDSKSIYESLNESEIQELEEELKIIRNWISFEPGEQAEKVYNKIADAHKLDEAEAYIESKLGSEVDWDKIDWFLRTEKDGGHAEELLTAIGLDTEDIQYDPHAGKALKKFAIYDDGNYVGDIEAYDEEDAVNRCYNGAFGPSSSDNMFSAEEIKEALQEAKENKAFNITYKIKGGEKQVASLDAEDKEDAERIFLDDYVFNPDSYDEGEEMLKPEDIEIISILEESLTEAKKDDELPVDPEAAKLEVHTMLNDLVADEIEAINGYEDAKKEILDAPISHKDTILDTVDHIEDEEKEHIDELIDATTEIPFDKEEAPAPVVEEPAVEEPAPVIEEPIVEEELSEDVDPTKVDLEDFDTAISTPGVWGIEQVGEDIEFFATEAEAREAFDNFDFDRLSPDCEGIELFVVNNEGEPETVDTKLVESYKAPVEENLNLENKGPFDQDFPKNKEKPLVEVAAPLPFDSNAKVGDRIKINHLEGEDDSYNGKEGEVTNIDSIGQLHGTWGGLAVIPGVDDYEVINEELTEASSAETKAYKNGGQDEKDLVQGRAIARIKDPKARDAAIAAVRAGRPEVAKQFIGSRKENQAIDAFDKKQAAMAKAGTKEALTEYWWEDGDPMNQVDQDEDNVKCGWCGEIFGESDCRYEKDFGYLCPHCEAALRSRGEELTFIEPAPVKEAIDDKDPNRELSQEEVDNIMIDWAEKALTKKKDPKEVAQKNLLDDETKAVMAKW